MDASNEIVRTIQYTQLCMALEMLQGETKRRFFSVDETKEVLESHAGWLIIFDNAPDAKVVQDLLPKTISGHVIVTLPNAPDAAEQEMARIEVPRLNPSQLDVRYTSVQLSDSIAGTLLHGNIAALDVLHSYCTVTGESLEEIIVTILQVLDKLENPTTHDLFKAVIRYPLAYLSKQDPVAKDFLVLCSFMAPTDIPMFVF